MTSHSITPTVSRRRLVQSGAAAAGLTIFWSNGTGAQQVATPPDATPIAPPEAGATPAATPEAETTRLEPPTDVDAYLRINEDGTITLLTGKIEFGQGIRTGFAQLAAEELSVPFESVNVIMGKTDEVPFDIGTFGSLSTRLTGPRIRLASAGMRQWLLELGAEELGVDIEDLTLEDGAVVATADGSNRVDYATLAAGWSAARELDPNVRLKASEDFTVIGQSIPRPDVADKVDGSAIYGIDVHVDDMAWGQIVRPPAFGATLTDIDFSEAEAMDGVVGTYRDGDFAGLVAETLPQAQAALGAVNATWEEPDTTVTHETIFDFLLETADEGQKLGDDNTSPGASDDITSMIIQPLKVTFRAPYVVHAPIEPRVAVAQVTDERVDIWTSTQDPFGVRARVAEALGRDVESVVVRPQHAGGAFGAKIVPMAESEAARLAQATGRPVKVLWSRADEFANAQYRPAMLMDITTGLDGDGNISGWQYDLYSASYFPAGTDNANSAAADWGANVLEIYDTTARTIWYQSDSPLPPYFWRVNGATSNTWAREVTMDMLAEQSGLDPVAFRLNHLGKNDRMATVLQAAVEQAGWEPGVGQTGQGIGVACAFDANTYVAEVARVELDEETGEILVRHIDVAIDCGMVVNPEAVRHQVEGSVVMGTSSTLREIVMFENGRVTNTTFAEYAPITMRETPSVETVIIREQDYPMGGVGEPAVAPATGAIANALYDLAGIRLFDTPFTPDRVLAELQNT
jgi:nicotinate dehydrogenase subunit B